MPSLVDRFAAAMFDARSALMRAVQAVRSPTNVSPEARVEGLPRWGGTQGVSARLAQSLGVPEAYLGRISYDAGPSWTRFSSYPANDLTPEKIVAAQREAVSGYPLRWMEMIEQVLSRDAHLSGIAQQRVDDVVKGSWRLIRTTDDDVADAVRTFCDEALRGVDTFDDSMAWLLMGNAYSYNATETVWKEKAITFRGPKGDRIGPVEVMVPSRLDAVHPKHFRFDLRTDEPLLWLGTDQVSLPYGKFVFFRGEGQHPITERRGFMWQCIWLSMIKSIGWAGWAVFVERYGLPTPLLKYDGDVAQYAEHKAAYEDIMTQLGQGVGGIFPSQNLTLDFAQPSQGGRSSDPHAALSDACDAAQSVRVLGATLTAKIGNVGSFSASSTHAEVKYAREEADARRLWASLRSDLLNPMVAFNALALASALTAAGYPCTPEEICNRVPRGLHRVPREIDPVQRAEVVTSAINDWGMKIGVESLYDEFNLSQPLGKDDVAPGRAQQVSSGGMVVGAVEASNDGAEAPAPDGGKAQPALPGAGAPEKNDEDEPEEDGPELGGKAKRFSAAAKTLHDLARGGAIVDPAHVFQAFGLDVPVRPEE